MQLAPLSACFPSDFITLDSASKRAVYQKANESHNVDLVRQLNNYGMKLDAQNFSRLSIISVYMDIATKYDAIKNFFKALRQNNRFLTEKEFQALPERKWVEKAKLSRILGRDHLLRLIMENCLTRMKVPLKIAVVEDTQIFEVEGYQFSNDLYDINSRQIKVYVEEIKYVKRKLTRVEIDELIQIIAAANFTDLCPGNIVTAEDGVYFIDSEFKSFNKSILWGNMNRFDDLIADEDKAYFEVKVNEQIFAPKEVFVKGIHEYSTLESILEMYESRLPPPADEKARRILENFKASFRDLQYVGYNEAGYNFLRPNKFSFNLSEIISS